MTTECHLRDICTECGQRIYLNRHPQATVTDWVHTDTGSRHCGVGADLGTAASPANAA